MDRASRPSNGSPGPSSGPPRPVAVFDIGGTWFRSGVLAPDGCLSSLARHPAVNYTNTPHQDVAELQWALIEYLVGEIGRLQAEWPDVDTASISLGAALNGHTGEVLQASPLWGPASGSFPVRQELERAVPGVRWLVVNDVTAALVRHAWEFRRPLADAGVARAALFTISTGIAARTFDLGRRIVPIDRAHGVQGEVGHIPINFRFRGTPFPSVCDCGGANHVNAFSSGRGIERIVRDVAAAMPQAFAASALAGGDSARLGFGDFAAAVDAGDPLAVDILGAACGPIADLIVQLLTYDPEVERVYMIGGVVGRLGDAYMGCLLDALDRRGMYQVTTRDPSYFRDRVVRGLCDDRSGLIGAGLCARALPAAAPAGAAISAAGEASTRTVRAARRTEYHVQVAPRLLEADSDVLLESLAAGPGDRRLVLIDDGAARHHGDRVAAYFRRRGVLGEFVPITTCERTKTLAQVDEVLRHFVRFGLLRRSEPVLAVGGGILTDVVGFAASVYRRGIPYVRVPTTLMGMVDAGIGVKTGVTFGGKNRLGSYYPPLRTLIDASFLRTLGPRHVRSGVAEIVKIGLVRPDGLFDRLDAHLERLIADRFQDEVGQEVIRRSVDGMLDELEPNLFEEDLARRVDFGHSFSPGIEVASGFAVLHGEAVAIDMAISAVLSARRGYLGAAIVGRVLDVLRRAGLPVTHASADARVVGAALRSTVEHRDGRQRVPLLAGIGVVRFVDDLTVAEVDAALAELTTASGEGRAEHGGITAPGDRPVGPGVGVPLGSDADDRAG